MKDLLFKNCLFILFVSGFCICPFASFGQENKEENEHTAHRVTISMGHAHVKDGLENGSTKWLIMGAWSLNYDYNLNSCVSVGLHNDVILEDFVVEGYSNREQHKELKRERPVAVKLVGSYKPGKHITFIAGMGSELSSSEKYILSTAGLEYGWHLLSNWELGAEVSYDFKWHGYDTWIVGIGVSRLIGRHVNKHKNQHAAFIYR